MNTDLVTTGRAARQRRRILIMGTLTVLVAALVAVGVFSGPTFYTPAEVLRVIAGQNVPGASFSVGELRLPRVVLAVLAGMAFGAAGVTFQTMLRNPLASPDIIGLSAGASAAAVIGIVMLGLSEHSVSLLATASALATAAAIWALSFKGRFAGTRLILIGIGLASMLNALISYVLSRSSQWDIHAAMQWLTGSLNGASWTRAAPLFVLWLVAGPVLMGLGRSLRLLQLSDDSASGLGVGVQTTRVALIVVATMLLAFATAACGPIAFVAFMSGPIAVRLVGPGGSLLSTSAIVGALLVLAADLIGQFAFGTRYPVGVITGMLGAPYLIILLIKTNRTGGSL